MKRPQNCGTGYCSCIECVMEPAPAPMAHIVGEIDHIGKVWQPAPVQRTWVGLTDEDRLQVAKQTGCMSVDWIDVIKATETALKIKNQ